MRTLFKLVVYSALAAVAFGCSNGSVSTSEVTGGDEVVDQIEGETELTVDDMEGECETNLDCVGLFPDKDVCQVALCDSVAHTCILGNAKDYTPCNDDDECTLETYCLDGACGNGLNLTCDDFNECTDDVCDPALGCAFTDNDSVCDDGNECTADDHCDGGVCVGTAGDCPCDTDEDCLEEPDNWCSFDPMLCGDDGFCAVEGHVEILCDDSLDTDCLQNVCEPASGECSMAAVADGTPCSDGSTCTVGDSCSGGVCESGDNKCPCETDADCAELEDGDLCNGTLVCEANLCAVDAATVVSCSQDGMVECEANVCDPATGACGVTAVANGAACDDGDICTEFDYCEAGECTGYDNPCEDFDDCTEDICDPVEGCVHENICGECGDSACDGPETCQNCPEDCGECEGDCCEPNETPGCADADVTDCMCDVDAFCCETEWDQLCVDQAQTDCDLQCGFCGDEVCDGPEDCLNCEEDCGECPPCGDDICDENESCEVCPEDCPCGGECGDDVCDGPETCELCPEDCGECVADPCVASEQPGCGGCEAEECVCTLDPYCCEVAWDQWCVGSYAQYCDGDCGAFCGDAFCDAEAGEDCVTCVKDCGPCPVECGDGVCDLLETCEECPEDCGECAECGDGLCQPPETCNNCEEDCGECGFCGDGECIGVEDCNNCEEDCGECGGTCEAAWSLACGTSDEWGLTEEGTTDAVSSYSCNQFNYDGPEYTYEFKATCDGLATVSLGDETSATDVMVLKGGAECDPSLCIAYGFTTAIFDVVAGGNYFIVVDGYQGAEGDYSIHLNCECGPECGNDMCEEGEDCVVCPEDCGECTGDCCTPHDSTGCDDADVETCVCALDEFCCEVFWDMLCVAEAQEECGLECEAECGDGICQAFAGEDCFMCPEDCGECPADVCDIDEAIECGMVSAASNAGMDNDVEEYSCSGKVYDAGEYVYAFVAPCDGPVTVNLLNETGATDLLVLGGEDGECAPWTCVDMGVSTVTLDAMAGELYYLVVDGAAGWEGDFDLQVECFCGVGDCCLPKGEPGCEQAGVQGCVCEFDPFCCEVAWDSTCVDEAIAECGLDCGGIEKCGDGLCAGDEDCLTCPEDCGDCCGNGLCQPELGEDCDWCPEDCGACPGEGSCCVANGSIGCDDPDVQECVCAMDPYCCETEWDSICAAEADECGSCTGDCCEANGTPGCDDEFVEACVCEQDPYCCSIEWDDLCAGEVEDLGCGDCGGVECGDGECNGDEDCTWCPEDCGECCGNGWCEAEFGEDCVTCEADCGACPGEGSCCISNGSPGCADASVEACVCAMDPFCCEVTWDGICAAEADECGSCTGDCCEANGTPGCDDEMVEACVCEVDPFCCDIAWDGICASEVEDLGCGSCGGEECGDGDCTGDEDCHICPDDCGDCCGNGVCEPEYDEDCDTCMEDCGECIDECEPMWSIDCGETDEWTTELGEAVVDAYNCVGGDYAAKEYVYQFVAPCNTTALFTLTKGPDVEGFLDILALDPAIGCHGDACIDYDWMSGDEAFLPLAVEEGQEYFIVIDGYNGAGGDYTLTVECECIEPTCGDGNCGDDETCANCPEDCGECEGSCCISNGSPGCDDPDVQACVCEMDPFCCDVEWDGLCAEEADECGSCDGDCCEANGTPGCEDEAVEACVCADDPFCCNVTWDGLCVDGVEGLGCGSCGGEECGDGMCTGTEDCDNCPGDCGECCGNGECEGAFGEDCDTCPEDCGECPGEGSCCLANGSPGCDNPEVQDCVCAMDPFCCETEWDGLCAATADECGSCGGDCCEANGTPGCDDQDVEACVCELDPFCCDVTWDSICADEAEAHCAADCSVAAGDCCEANGTPGCDDADCEATVCEANPFCCETAWDGICADEAAEMCPLCAGEPWCGDAECNGEENCANCPEDCGGCEGDCCESNGTPGCEDIAIQDCVCELDPFCCEVNWDGICAGEAEIDCGADCGGIDPLCGDDMCNGDEDCETCPQDCGFCPGEGSCCISNGSPGCDDPEVQACVCEMDPFCCNNTWDGLCAAEADDCGSCDGDCCESNGTPGCDDEDIEACVCEMDPYCCDVTWDGACATEAENDCGAICGETKGDCCEANGTPGCEDGECEAIICAADPFCCSTAWDAICAGDALEMCVVCGAGPFCGDGDCGDDENCGTCPGDCGPCDGNCCLANGTPGCEDPEVTACVCEMDPYCCNNQWDGLCAAEADECGTCNGDCCVSNGTPGCDDEDCEATVCEADPFCCNVFWDGQCAGEAADMCEICIVGPECGDGSCNGAETCEDCPEDCGWCEGEGSCCIANGTPGCDDPAVTECVCDMDPYCCLTAWDGLCASEADECGSCNGDCCVANGNAGCDDEGCEAIVCEADPYCCDVTWDNICANEALDVCDICVVGPECGDDSCNGDETCEDCPEDCGFCEGEGSCCIANGSAGCDDPDVQACVCDFDPYCCTNTWDGQCAGEADECGSCNGDCCAGNDTPGCDDETCEANVCEVDPYCCNTKWDGICAGEADDMCAMCAPEPFCGDGDCGDDENCVNCAGDCGGCQGDCCASNGSIGCNDPACQAAVCAADPWCCNVNWDGACADGAEDLCPACAQGCEPGDVPDCNGDCFPSAWIGDGVCDNDVNNVDDGLAHFYCPAFGWDGGDC